MGYTPLFDSLTKGTLCGRWPDIGLWPIVLSMADKDGIVDVTPTHIASVTGLELEEVIACMARFCEPDPYSRSTEAGGARLELLDPGRPWGWRIINHSKYREKARLQAKSAREVETGRNRERMQDRRGPPETAANRPSNANANSDTNEEEDKDARRSGARVPSRHIDLVFEHWQTVHGHPQAKPTEKRRRRIAERLKRFSLDELRQAIDGYKLSPFHMGANKDGVKYDDIELFMRSDEHVEKGLGFARDPPKPVNGGSVPRERKTRFEELMGALDDGE